jgi:glycosyltransferase involved in cell wall biosynthesis
LKKGIREDSHESTDNAQEGITMPVKISVIIPAYNAAKFIKPALHSVLAQKYSDESEIIVIDDGSTDNTQSIISEMSQLYKQIISLQNERNKGPSGARNTGLLKAQGEYIAFLDADDVWLPNHLAEGVNFLEKQDKADSVFFNFDVVDYETQRRLSDWFSQRKFILNLKTEPLGDQYYLICDEMFDALIDETFIHLQSLIIRKKALKEVLFNEKIMRSEDRDFTIQLYKKSKACFAYKNIITGIYYRHEQSLTNRSLNNALSDDLDQIKLFSEYLSTYSLDAFQISKIKKILFEKCMSGSYHQRKFNNYNFAIDLLFKTFNYKISYLQIKELLKIIVSFFLYQFCRQ